MRWLARLGFALGGGKNTMLQQLNLASNRLLIELELDYKHFGILCGALGRHHGVQELNLSFNYLGLEAAKLLAGMASHSRSLRVLELQGNRLGAKGAAELCKGLALSKKVEVVNLSDNELGDDGAGKVAVMLVMNRSIISLTLDRNDIGCAGTMQLGSALAKNSTLQHLALRENDVCDLLRTDAVASEGVEKLASREAARSLTSLSLSGSPLGSDAASALSKLLAKHDTLTEVDISSCSIQADCADDLVRMMIANPRIERLHLFQNPLNWGAIQLDDETSRRIQMFEGF